MNNVPQITAEEVKASIDAKEEFILLDVRTPGEYGRGKIKNSRNKSRLRIINVNIPNFYAFLPFFIFKKTTIFELIIQITERR